MEWNDLIDVMCFKVFLGDLPQVKHTHSHIHGPIFKEINWGIVL